MANPPTAPSRSSDFMFPSDLTDQQKNYAMSFTFYKYQRDSLSAGAKLQPSGQGLTIMLPMPDTINDIVIEHWGSKALDPSGKAEGFFPFSTLARLGGIETLSEIGGYLTGYIPNPVMIALFQGPEFKEFEFSWTLVPRNKQESETIHSIVNSFKKYMLPTKQGWGKVSLLLGYPNIIQAKFIPDDFLYQFKPMAIRNCSVNYAPSGPAFYKETGAPAAVQLRLSTMEIEYWTQEDYEEAKVGF